MIRNVFNGIDKETGDIKTKELYFSLKNVLNEYEFYKQVNYLCYQSYCDKLSDKVNAKKASIDKLYNSNSFSVDKANKLNDELKELELELELVLTYEDNYIYPQEEIDSMSIIFAYAFCGITANINGKFAMVQKLRNFYNSNVILGAEDNKKATLKSAILEFANSKIKTTDDSGIFKNFKLDRISDTILNDIVATCARMGKWSKNGLYLDAKKEDAITREVFKILLVCKYGAQAPTAKKASKICRYSI